MAGFIGGPLQIDNIGGQSIVNFGGSFVVSPKHISKTFSGSGGGHNAAINISFTAPSSTNTVLSDLIDQPLVPKV